MPVPVVMVALAGGAGGRVIEKNGREVAACEGGVFFLPAYTPVVVCSCGGAGEGIEMALAHTNLHWGSLAVPPPVVDAVTASAATAETSVPSPQSVGAEAAQDGGVTNVGAAAAAVVPEPARAPAFA